MEQPRRHAAQTLFVLALFGVFALSSLLVVLLGANVYSRTLSRSERNFSDRTSVLYLAEKLRQNDEAGAIRKGSVGGADALCLLQTIGATDYETWIFCADGELREAFVSAKTEVNPSDGQKIMPLLSLSCEQDETGAWFFSTLTPEGSLSRLIYTPRSEGTP